MGGEWPLSTLEDAGIVLLDCVHRTPSAVAEGFPYIAIPQMKNGVLEFADVRLISETDFEEWTKKALPKAWDVVLSRRCNPGVTAHVPQDVNFALGQNLVLLRADGKKIFPPFLRWVTKSPKWWDEVQKFINVGAVFESLRCADIPQFKIPVPDIQSQRAIDHILGSLDDKIELNRQMNRTLEKMAQAIFKSWFIDFDPVHAKAEGRDPDLPKEIVDLFPDNFEDSELGPIPTGWKVKTLYDLFDLIGGGTPKTSVPEYWGGSIPWFSVVDAPSVSDVFVINTEKHITELGVKKSSTKILPSGTTIISARGTVGKCAVVGIPMAMNQSCYGIRGKNGIEDGFVYYTIREQVTDLQRSGHGSVFNTITRETFKSIRVPFASSQLTKAFENRITPFFDKIRYNLSESNTLISLRDTLLPKLISGELRVPDVEKLVEGTL